MRFSAAWREPQAFHRPAMKSNQTLRKGISARKGDDIRDGALFRR